MTPYFADSFYYLALLSREDEAHQRALALTRELTAPVVTTGWVLTEVGNALAGLQYRSSFLELLDVLRTDPRVEVVPASEELFNRGLALFAKTPRQGVVSDGLHVVCHHAGTWNQGGPDRGPSLRASRLPGAP